MTVLRWRVDTHGVENRFAESSKGRRIIGRRRTHADHGGEQIVAHES
ncbi:hypothetical protein [Methylosinus sp. RM1]|nr:hypothetical protein [Methylosinus sp. RM1]